MGRGEEGLVSGKYGVRVTETCVQINGVRGCEGTEDEERSEN